ncbi:DUF4405 domain-containing protein [uncultured Desulfosarcina sp.]|uniref:DUF4405 domain-containing protein n=1 Tax=uncultured Desulfosarcina sp. TaxID=218289 RepID=UPI0029C9305D|nr:DUF4405 domain-containing protein [uncultured Desulfosarcina sp.]
MGKPLKLWTVNVISFVLFSLLAVTGLVNWLVLPHGSGHREGLLIGTRHLLMEVHAWLAILFLVAIAIHLGLHGSYIKANLKKSGLLKK